MRTNASASCLLLSAALAACTSAPEPTARLSVAVAPLQLADIGVACYDLRVRNATEVVWHEGDPNTTLLGADQDGAGSGVPSGNDSGTICSDQYGNASGGDVAYVGPCDSTSDSDLGRVGVQNTVTVWVDGLYNSDKTVDVGDWEAPCPFGCQLRADCVEEVDTFVLFDLTIMRRAKQGFFDVAVNFEDVFCSAKLDSCYDDSRHIELLSYEGGGPRDWTAVFGLACSAGRDSVSSNLMYGRIVIDCGAIEFEIEPGAEEGNTIAIDGGETLHYAVYRGVEELQCGNSDQTLSCKKKYWNLAFSLDDLAAIGGTCLIGFEATVNDDGIGWSDGRPSGAGVVYPYIRVKSNLTNNGAPACQRSALDTSGGAVATVYRGNISGIAPPLAMCDAYDGTLSTIGAVGCDACDFLVCNDSSVCTADSCAEGACIFTPIGCDDGDACTTNLCHRQTGCYYEDIETPACQPECVVDGDCGSDDQCTTYTCDDGVCVTDYADCDDDNLCTADGCNASSGCTHLPVSCDDYDDCTTDSCDPDDGCEYQPVPGCN